MKKNNRTVSGSFRDPSGFLFYEEERLYRKVSRIYQENYDMLFRSGLYDSLVKDNMLVPHREVTKDGEKDNSTYKIIEPEIIPYISYPYEWCFGQLKDAAFLTLEVQKSALKHGMSLKDSSAYNIQFRSGSPVFIDTLSFEKYREGEPWSAYRQFCQHFLAPLALISYKDVRLAQLLRVFIDGIPLDIASLLLPLRTRLKFSLLTHIHLHAKSQKHYADKVFEKPARKMSLLALNGLIDTLESAVSKLNWNPGITQWSNYYDETNYSKEALKHKKELIAGFLAKTDSKSVLDIGCNTGIFSRISGDRGIFTIACDMDPGAVEKNYRENKLRKETNILPLLIDAANPSPGIGWENNERESFMDRLSADTVFALALIHHLAISNNLPFCRIASFFSKICAHLIIEFVPKTDSQIKKLLASREDIFTQYNRENFEKEFCLFFTIVDSQKIRDSERIVYLMKKRQT